MKRKSNSVLMLLGAVLLAMWGNSFSQSEMSSPVPILSSYFDMLVTGNFESAGYMWNRAALERSSKLGIKYQNIPLKIDCTSPIVQNIGLMKDYLQPPVKRVTSLFDGKYQKLFYAAIVQGIPVEHTYFAEFDGKYYWLTYPQDIYAGNWPVKESGYFRVHIHPEMADHCNGIMFETADRFVEQMADSLGISDNDLRHLQASKIDFYFCNSDETVEQITGKKTRGLYDKASSDIISSFFPHNHEVLHLLVDFKLKDLPLFVHPLFEEGLAVHYGGRWGKSTEALMPLGIYLYEEGLVHLDTLISFSGFRGSAESDIAYPLAALFNRFILEKIGREKYFSLYRKVSGSFKELSILPADSVKEKVLQSVSAISWEKFVKDFNEYLKAYKSSQFAALPGSSGNGKVLIENASAIVRNDGEWLEFEFLTAENPSGNLLFGSQKEVPLTYSAMYSEHYGKETAFDGYRYGLRFDVNEAGLYDYATNTLLAKYIAGVDPSPDYYNQNNHKINIRIRKSLTNGVVPSETDYKLLKH